MTKEGRKESKLKQYMIAPFRILNKARQLYMKGVVECAGGYGGYAGGALSPALVHRIPATNNNDVHAHRKQRREALVGYRYNRKKMIMSYHNEDEPRYFEDPKTHLLHPVLSQPVDTLPGFPAKLPFKLQTGYVGVGHMDSVQLYYLFVESERNPEEDPLLLWLSGGPGCSGFSGLSFEREWKLPSLKLNPFSWTKVANMIFIDAPVGTGFSYATNPEAYGVTDTLAAAHNYEFLRKWLMSNPRFQKNPLYIAGDSYSGIILPILVKTISDGNESGEGVPGGRMNLKGYILGNPVTDLFVDENWRIPFYHKLALISDPL
ncbi:hypothetical protein PIB30_034445 [Stylosanthes scabra]|uniref:Uncharacterized protein n=1 Tax=Stylosanthes scabra TaxID=79078 RepID=A0ABU6SD04_9FABA|nr:hypothetical protein [Stylosanthes scabra]